MGDGSGGNVGDGEQWGAADEASLACPLLTSCYAACFLTGHGPVLVRGPGVGDPCLEICIHSYSKCLGPSYLSGMVLDPEDYRQK